MLSKQMLYNLENSSAIRQMFIEGQELAARVGAENVYDFSLGNPAAPVPEAFTQALLDIIQTEDSLTLHGYMNNAGYPEVRQAVADSLNRRFGLSLGMENIIMTNGAAGAINIVFKAILDVEMCIPAQVVDDIRLAVTDRCPIETCLHAGGEIMGRGEVMDAVRKLLER